MNNISNSRLEIKQFFDQKKIVEGSEFSCLSPNAKYRMETVSYLQNKPDVNWTVTEVKIFDSKSNELLSEFFTDYHSFFHEWFISENREYLVGAEVLCGGQTVIDLLSMKIESYCPPDDGFIWSDFYFSPDGFSLAVVGCFWACPYEVRVYDFKTPLLLPLTEITSVSLEESELDNIEWIDNRSFKTKRYDKSYRTHSLVAT